MPTDPGDRSLDDASRQQPKTSPYARLRFATADPPLAAKARSSVRHPAHDEFERFDLSISPVENGDDRVDGA